MHARRYAARHAAPSSGALAAAVPVSGALAAAVPAVLGVLAPAAPVVHADLDARVVSQEPAVRSLVTRVTSVSSGISYTVAAGDTLSGIAGRACGNPSDWPAIWHANQAEVPDPDVIYPGQVLIFTCAELMSPSPPAPVQAPAQAPVTGAVSTAGMSAFEQCVITRESGGDPQVMNASGHYGLFQFDLPTWESGGGNPADFGHASVAEQEQAFASVYAARGAEPWAPSDGCT